MSEDTYVTPQSVPTEVLKRRESIWLYMIAVGALAVMGVVFVIGIFVLSWAGRNVPEGAWVVFGSIVAGLVGMVAVQSRDAQAA